MTLRSEEKYVVVEINDKVELIIGMESTQMEKVLTGTIRLALGGMLVDQKRLLHPVSRTMLHVWIFSICDYGVRFISLWAHPSLLLSQFYPEMDACIRAGNWLNLSTSWDAEPGWKPSTCFPEIKKGSYFPGSGFALYNTSGGRLMLFLFIQLCLKYSLKWLKCLIKNRNWRNKRKSNEHKQLSCIRRIIQKHFI